MPLHAQIACIGGNGAFALLFLIAAMDSFGKGESGMATFLGLLGLCAAYTCWVLLKFRRYLSVEESVARELQIERMREEIDVLKSNNAPGTSD